MVNNIRLTWKLACMLKTYRTCVVVIHSYLQLRLIRHEWGASFFDVGVSLKNCSRCLQRTKSCGSFSPKADKHTASGSSPTKRRFWRQCLSKVLSALGEDRTSLLPWRARLYHRYAPVVLTLALITHTMWSEQTRAVKASLKNCHPKWTIPLMGTALKITFLWGEDLFQTHKQFVCFGAKRLAQLCSLQATWAVF